MIIISLIYGLNDCLIGLDLMLSKLRDQIRLTLLVDFPQLFPLLCENSVACSRILTCFNFQMLHMTVEQQLMNNMIGLKSTFASQQSTDDELVSV